MSPTDEIRYINKLAAKRGRKNLSPYQRWVLGGCRGPNPALRRRRGGRRYAQVMTKRKSRPKTRRAEPSGPCRKTKITAAEAVRLTAENARLKKRVRKLRHELKILRDVWAGK